LARKAIKELVDICIPADKRKVLLSWTNLLQRTVKSLKEEAEKNEEIRLNALAEKIEELKAAEEDRITASETRLKERVEEHNKKIIFQSQQILLQTADKVKGEQIQTQENFGKHVKLEKENVSEIASEEKINLEKIALDSKKSNRLIWIWGLIFVILFGTALAISSFTLGFRLYQKSNQQNDLLAENLKTQAMSLKKLEKTKNDLVDELIENRQKTAKLLKEFKTSFQKEKAKWRLAEQTRKAKWEEEGISKDYDFPSFYWIYMGNVQCSEDLEKKFKTLASKTKTAISRINTVANTVNENYKVKKAPNTIIKKVIPKKKLPKLAKKARKRKSLKKGKPKVTIVITNPDETNEMQELDF
jgi:hypothetical protein